MEACCGLLRGSDFGVVHQVLTFTRRQDESATSHATPVNTFLLAQHGVLVPHRLDYLTPA